MIKKIVFLLIVLFLFNGSGCPSLNPLFPVSSGGLNQVNGGNKSGVDSGSCDSVNNGGNSGCGTGTGTTTTTTTPSPNTGGPLNITVKTPSQSSDSGSITISQGTIPTISWNYTGVSGNLVEVYVTANSKVMWCLDFSSSIKSVTYGVAPSGSTEYNSAQSLAKGTYSVYIHLYSSSSIIGQGYGSIIVQ
ncbi:MAG: hypothetical protein ABH873_00815 [Candidatus Firestonebacteria bacterium]